MPISRRTFAATTASLTAVPGAAPAAPPRRNLLTTAWPLEKLPPVLVPRERWQPFPAASDRAGWEALPGETRKTMIDSGERALGGPWPVLRATLFLEYKRVGNRSRYEAAWRIRRNRLRELTLAECAEGKGRFLDEIANGIWATCEETFWGYPAHLNLQKRGSGLPDVSEPVIDLFAAETGAQLAWTYYLLGAALDRVHPMVRERVDLEIRRRILDPYREREDWGWMGLRHNNPVNNWNPWINSNLLTCALAIESDPERRAALVHKVMRSLDRFIDSYHDDGGCDEGPGYWGRAGGSLFDNLELLHSASARKIDFYSVPLIQEIGRYIYRVHIHDTWYVNFADASARNNIAGDLVFRYGRRIGDEHLQSLGAWAVQESDSSRGDTLGRQLPALFNREIANATPRQPLLRDAWLPGIQVMTARLRNGSAEGLYLAAQGGHNAESHNHNDVGNFVVFSDGEPALIDVGVETYSAKTFSAQRYEIWTMQSAYHNLPTVNGVMQSAGRQYAAREVSCGSDDTAAEFSLDIAGGYPPAAGLESYRRVLRLDRNKNEVQLSDRYALAKPGGRIALTLMTPCQARVDAGRIQLADRAAVLFDGLKPTMEEVKIEDARLRSVWGERLYRILLAAENLPARGELTLRIVRR